MDISTPIAEPDESNKATARNDLNNNVQFQNEENLDSPKPGVIKGTKVDSEVGDKFNSKGRETNDLIHNLATFFTRKDKVKVNKTSKVETTAFTSPFSPLPPFPIFGLSNSSDEPSKSLNLVKFITAGMVNHLKILGMDDLDCKECVDTWLSHRRQKKWKQSLPNTSFIAQRDSRSCLHPEDFNITGFSKGIISTFAKPEKLNAFNPSAPNSSIFRISGHENEELAQFLSKMEEVRTHLNNASCTLLQVTMILILPYFKLLTGNQLDTSNHEAFIEDWIQIIVGVVKELKPESSKEVSVMLSREFQSVCSESKKLYKRLSKLYLQVAKLYEENGKEYKKFLGRLHPRSLTVQSRVAKRNNNESVGTLINALFISERVHFAPVPLYRTNITVPELLKNHLFLSKSTDGNTLVFKKEMEAEWKNFANLPFPKRREVLLTVLEDLKSTLKSSSNGTNHIKELFIEGYPENICSKISENLAYLKKASKQNELLVLSKVTIATHVKSFLESLARLVRVLKDTLEVSKYLYKNIEGNCKGFSRTRPLLPFFSPFKNKVTNLSSVAKSPDGNLKNSLPLKYDNAKVKLLVSFPISLDPMEDQFLIPLA